MFNYFLMLNKNIKSYNINRTLKKAVLKNILISFFDNMKDKKKVEISLEVNERVYTKTPGMQKLIKQSMIDVCKEENMSPELVFFFFTFLYSWLYCYGLSKSNFLLCEGQLIKILGCIFSSD